MKNFQKLLMVALLSLPLASAYAISPLLKKNVPVAVLLQAQGDKMDNVYTAYFGIKDALVKSDGKTAASKASELVKAIAAISMDKMKPKQHSAWMKVLPQLKEDAEHISETNDAKRQRDHFVTLSTNMHTVMQAFGSGQAVYYQKCPMANGGKGANWLSKEKAIKNPYYGSAMLTCGSTVETLK